MLDSCSLRTGVWENLSLKGLHSGISPDYRVPHRHLPLFTSKCKLLEKMKSVSVSFRISPLFLLICQNSANTIYLFPGPSTCHSSSANQFAPQCVSAAAGAIIPIIASHFNGLLESTGKSYPICNVSSQHLEKAWSLCHFLRRASVLWWHLRAFIISVRESLGHTLVSLHALV